MYSFEQAFEASIEYFGGDELAAKVFLDKYAMKDINGNLLEKTPEDMHKRMAKEFARIESKKFKNPLTEEEIFGLFDRFKYVVPQGSPMFGIGNNHQIVSLSNCYVVESPEDSYGGICRVDEMLCQISKRRGGVGLDISKIRPAGTGVKNAARNSTGVVSFMERYSNTIREVGQSGRRGALMLTIHVAHPDIEQFVTIKNDATKVTGANISVLLSDEFLTAVEKGEKFRLRFPVDAPPSDTDRWVDAKELWMKMINNAWLRAEPGLLFWDKIKKYNAVDCYHEEGFDTVSTNPCCFAKSSEVMVITKDGIKEIKTITSNDEIWIDDEQVWAKTTGYFDAGKAEVFKVTFSNNEELFITANHKLAKTKFKRVGSNIKNVGHEAVELKNLKVGDPINVHVNTVKDFNFGKNGTYEEGLIMGWLTGDGCLSFHKKGIHSYDRDKFHGMMQTGCGSAYPDTILDFWENEYDVCDRMLEIFTNMGYRLKVRQFENNGNTVKRIGTHVWTQYFTNKYQTNVWNFKSNHEYCDFLYSSSKDFIKGYLQSYFGADGHVAVIDSNVRYSVGLGSINHNRLKQIKYLLNLFGIKSSVRLAQKSKWSNFRGTKYRSSDLYELKITGRDNIEKFAKEIGFICERKQKALMSIFDHKFIRQQKSGTYAKIKSIESIGIQDIGCIEVDSYHRFTANGLISFNSEITLSKFDSCRLMAMNLYSYVVDPFTNGSYFDYDLFEKHGEIIQRLMDDMIDLEEEKILQIIAKIKKDPEEKGIKARELELWQNIHDRCIKGRRTGTGVTAMGDTLAALGLKYGSEESISEVSKIMKTLCLSSFRSSMEMAKDIGTFPIWNWQKEKDSEFLAMIKENDPKLYKEISVHGRRNIANLTIAPTGTVSILTQTTSGVEPLFMLFPYTRRKKINPTDKNVKVDFVDQNGDSWQEFTVYHPKVQKWMEITGEKDLTKSPWHGCCAEEINWVNAVRLQAAAQKYIDHAISKTVNLPADVTVEEVAKIYEAAWKYGVKGCTIYRSGCRTGVLVDKTKEEKSKNKIQKNDAPKRPASIDAEVHFSKVKGDDYYVVVGLLEGDPYEVFAGTNSSEGKYIIKKGTSTGKLKKKARGQYALAAGEETYTLTNIHNHENGDSLCRMLSTALRHGADINFVVHQLEKTEGDLSSLSKVLARSLKKYIKDGSSVSGEDCGQCEGGKLERQDGCVICKSCGWTKCG